MSDETERSRASAPVVDGGCACDTCEGCQCDDKDDADIQEAVPIEPEIAVDESQAELVKAQSQRDEYLAMAKRVQADFDNYRRRTHASSLESYDNGRASVIEQVLPVLDNLERAVISAQDETTKAGVSLVVKQFLEMLDKWGVSVIDRKGEAFDPNLENAVMRGESGEGEPGSVMQVLQRGYKMGTRVLRHAMVKVAAE